MSTFKVEIIKIDDVMVHPNADRLELVKVKDWICVTSKGSFQKGDAAVYFPIDSILNHETESKIFSPDSKIKLDKSRVRTIKIRGAISQGLVIKPEVFFDLDDIYEGEDVTEQLGVKKYEPPTGTPSTRGHQVSKKQVNPHFRKYTGIENAKNYPKLFEEGEEVSVTEKVHGSNFRAGYLPYSANTVWKKIKQWFGFVPKWEFVYGSHNVQLQNKIFYKGYYKSNIYEEMVIKYDLKTKLQPGEVVYGEVYGDGVQRGYKYGCKPNERCLVLFDLMKCDKWVDTIAFRKWGNERQLNIVPELYRGPFNKEKILSLKDGDSVLDDRQKIREGVIVKPLIEEHTYAGRKVLKFISDNYLLKNKDDETIGH